MTVNKLKWIVLGVLFTHLDVVYVNMDITKTFRVVIAVFLISNALIVHIFHAVGVL
jgi:hypothetical protein